MELLEVCHRGPRLQFHAQSTAGNTHPSKNHNHKSVASKLLFHSGSSRWYATSGNRRWGSPCMMHPSHGDLAAHSLQSGRTTAQFWSVIQVPQPFYQIIRIRIASEFCMRILKPCYQYKNILNIPDMSLAVKT